MIVGLSLISAIVYGAADFFGGLASKRTNLILVVALSQGAGLVVLALTLPFAGGEPTAGDLGFGLACGVIGACAIAALYRGLAIGTMGVVSPITAVFAAIIPVAFGVAFGERPPPLTLIGIAIALIAVACISAAPPPRASPRSFLGVPEAIAAGIAFGVFFIVLAHTRTQAGLWPLASARVASLALFGIPALRMRATLTRAALPTIALSGALDMGANILYTIAAHRGMLAIVAVLTSLYPASTVALAAIALRERLAPVQWLGVACALAGIGCITLGR